MRIAIVNDMALAVEALRRVVVSVPEFEVVWIARDGAEAVQKCATIKPDLILMDLIMPNMDGVQATQKIMAATPCPILVVTATVSGNISQVFDAMGHGALDAVCTPVLGTNGDMGGAEPFLNKIKMIKTLLKRRRTNTGTPLPPPSSGEKKNVPPLIVIGSSTGGPKALADVLTGLPSNFGSAIVVVQHVDQHFTPGLADWLNQQSPLKVELIQEGNRPQPGKVWMACTNDHLVFNSDLAFTYTRDPLDNPYRPSVDIFFNSCARHVPGTHTAVVLTGMGRDGATGMLSLKKRKWLTIAQDQKSSAVYGMPKAAADMQAATEILSAHAISRRLREIDSLRKSPAS